MTFLGPAQEELVFLFAFLSSNFGESVSFFSKLKPPYTFSHRMMLIPILEERMLKMDLATTLYEIGITPAYVGYRYIFFGCRQVQDDMSLLTSVTKRLYPMIAEEYGVSPKSVEAAMRRAIKMSWESSNRSKMERIVRHLLPEPPSASHFLAQLAFYTMEDPAALSFSR